MGHTFGFARVSTDDQDLSLQIDALTKYGIPEALILSEHASGKTVERRNIDRIFRNLTRGDTLVVWKLDRLGRTLTGVLEVIERLDQEGIEFVSLTESFDTSTPMGKAFMQIALVFAELERNMISERTRAGMAARKAEGAKFGRRRLIQDFPKRLELVQRLDAQGKLRAEDGMLLISRQALLEQLNDADPKAPQIKNTMTIKRWQDDKFPGLDEMEAKNADI